MPPHGPGLYGAGHSHDPEYPEDNWNLYSMMDRDGTTALNATRPDQAIGIFKPHVLRLSETPAVISDADPELLVIARFTSPVNVRKIMVIGGGAPEQHPCHMKCFVNHEDIDFTNIETIRPSQQFNLPLNEEGLAEITTSLHAFTNVSTLAFYFPMNFGGNPNTVLKYIGLQGDHSHYRREAVDTTYEVLCNGQDICQPEGSGTNAPHMH